MPRGNPDLAQHGFKTNRPEPLTAHVALKMPASLKAKLQEKENWQEFVRQTLQKALDLESA